MKSFVFVLIFGAAMYALTAYAGTISTGSTSATLGYTCSNPGTVMANSNGSLLYCSPGTNTWVNGSAFATSPTSGVNLGGTCSPNGSIGIDSLGRILECQNGHWALQSFAGAYPGGSCSPNGAIGVDLSTNQILLCKGGRWTAQTGGGAQITVNGAPWNGSQIGVSRDVLFLGSSGTPSVGITMYARKSGGRLQTYLCSAYMGGCTWAWGLQHRSLYDYRTGNWDIQANFVSPYGVDLSRCLPGSGCYDTSLSIPGVGLE